MRGVDGGELAADARPPAVLLVHGLGRTPASLAGLAAALRRAGQRPRFFGYSPTFETVPGITRRLAARLNDLARPGRPVGAVGHSLGGLLLRLALPAVPPDRVHQLVMLGTPNRPPRLARAASRWAAFRWLAGGCGRLLASPDAVTGLPPPAVPYTLVAGTAGPRGRWSPFGDDPNDGVVGVDEVPVRDGDAPLLLPVWHTVMMNDRRVQRAVVAALAAGRTPRQPAEGNRCLPSSRPGASGAGSRVACS